MAFRVYKLTLFFAVFASCTTAGADPVVVVGMQPVAAARAKILERDRAGALAILNAALETEKTATKKNELIKERHRLATLFLSNEGQRLFELGESIRYGGQAGFMPKYDEALKLEGAQWDIHMARALGFFQQKSCQKAVDEVTAAEALSPMREETLVLRQRGEVCSGVAVVENLEKEINSYKSFLPFRKALLAQRAYEDGRREVALRWAREAVLADTQFPTGYYWAWQVLKEEPGVGLDEAQRYLSLCKNVTPALRRKYFLDPELCAHTEPVEEFIKKWESQTP